MILPTLLLAVLPLLPPASQPAGGAGEDLVRIPAGSFVPQFSSVDGNGDWIRTPVESYELDVRPVTIGQYLAFVEENPAWRRSRVPAVLAGKRYLARWDDDLDPGLGASAKVLLDRPITEVSWFAARAYCAARDARLPTTGEWEYAASASAEETDAALDPDFNRVTRRLQALRPAPDEMPPVGRTFRNAFGVWDLHGLIWEWTSDFNSQMATGSGRDDQGLDRGLFCAAGSRNASDRSDYTAFLRHAHRTSLRGADANASLGFRCARSIDSGRDTSTTRTTRSTS